MASATIAKFGDGGYFGTSPSIGFVGGGCNLYQAAPDMKPFLKSLPLLVAFAILVVSAHLREQEQLLTGDPAEQFQELPESADDPVAASFREEVIEHLMD